VAEGVLIKKKAPNCASRVLLTSSIMVNPRVDKSGRRPRAVIGFGPPRFHEPPFRAEERSVSGSATSEWFSLAFHAYDLEAVAAEAPMADTGGEDDHVPGLTDHAPFVMLPRKASITARRTRVCTSALPTRKDASVE
jgi:hypothetical protein